MPKNFSTKLACQISESILVAELGRRGILATTFSGNVPDIDVLAYRDGRSIPIQVKTLKAGMLSADAKHFLQIEFDGEKQIVKGKNKDLDRELIFVIIITGKKLGDETFYICKKGFIQDLIYRGYKDYLKRFNGIRPRNSKSTHSGVLLKELTDKRDNWALIENALK